MESSSLICFCINFENNSYNSSSVGVYMYRQPLASCQASVHEQSSKSRLAFAGKVFDNLDFVLENRL